MHFSGNDDNTGAMCQMQIRFAWLEIPRLRNRRQSRKWVLMPPCQKYQKTMKNCCSSEEKTLSFQHTRQSWRFIILLLSLIFYTCVCAAVFSSLEKDNDREHYDRSQGLKKSYKLKYNMSEEEFIEFVSDVSIWYKRGYIHGYKNYWNFYHSFWFTTTVVTTMGECGLRKLILFYILVVISLYHFGKGSICFIYFIEKV